MDNKVTSIGGTNTIPADQVYQGFERLLTDTGVLTGGGTTWHLEFDNAVSGLNDNQSFPSKRDAVVAYITTVIPNYRAAA